MENQNKKSKQEQIMNKIYRPTIGNKNILSHKVNLVFDKNLDF